MRDEELEALSLQIAVELLARGWMLGTVESCTGGGVAQALTSVSGSSTWFERGLVTYSNQSKQDLAGVQTATLERHGAVSEETAREMASGLVVNSPVQVALSVTGIAGPTGGTAEKPVGMVCFAWVTPVMPISSTTLYFEGDREEIRRQAVAAALSGLLARL